jgi:hypothetical protein
MKSKINEHLLEDTQRIIFFDIDSTLTSVIDHHTLAYQTANQLHKRETHESYNWKTIRFPDYVELSSSCLALFANFLRQTGAKAVCISSWNTMRCDGVYLKELQEAFESISEFPSDWLLGFTGCGGGDRWEYTIKPFLEEYDFTGSYVAIDDRASEYSNQSKAVSVDPRTGFSYREYEACLSLFGIKEGMVYSHPFFAR